MKTFIYVLIGLTFPMMALADGGHPHVGDSHAIAHILYYGLPVIAVGLVGLRQRLITQQKRKAQK